MLEGAKRRVSMCQAFSIRESYIVPVSSNFLTHISHGTRTKCRKTRAMLRDFSTVACLALRQLRHFYGTRCSFAKIAIPYTIYPSLNLLEFYVCINYAMTRKNIAFSFISIKTQKSSYNRQIFAQIKLQKNIDSFKKK